MISTMGNGQDWVRKAANFGGESGTCPQAGVIISFAGGGYGTPTEYGHVAFVEKVSTQTAHALSPKPSTMAIQIIPSVNYLKWKVS